MRYQIAPSLLAADFTRLGEEVTRIADEADLLHLDLMDGHFVPSISFGPPVIAALRPRTALPFDCHLMVTNPADHLDTLRDAGADLVSVHIETVPDPTTFAAAARSAGLRFGLVLAPGTPWYAVEPFVELCDLLVVMSVEPGASGRSFEPEVLPKIELARKWVDSHGLATDIEVDGGITEATAGPARDAGANVFVAGASVFRSSDPQAAIRRLRDVIEGRG